jgi:hypothetical protein
MLQCALSSMLENMRHPHHDHTRLARLRRMVRPHSHEAAHKVDVLRQAAREICRRLMDAVEPHLVDEAEQALRATPGVIDIGQVRLRWIGHQLRAECEIIVDPDLSAIQAHQVAVSTEHALPRLSSALVHADPRPRPGTDYHAVLASHQ